MPFVGSYRPFWQGLGTVGLELILALVVTSLLRTRMPERVWRGVHWLAYVSWPVAFAHGLGNGTDSGAGWMRAIAGCSALTVRRRHRLAARPALHRAQQGAPAADPPVGAGPGKDPMNAATLEPLRTEPNAAPVAPRAPAAARGRRPRPAVPPGTARAAALDGQRGAA